MHTFSRSSDGSVRGGCTAAVATLTPAPVIDRTYVFDQLVQGEVNRTSEVYEFMSARV